MSRVGDFIAFFDQFGQRAELRVSRKNKTKKSVMGSLVTLAVIITTVAYMSTKLLELTGRKNTSFSQYLAPNNIHIEQVTNMTVGQVVNGYNFNVAWGMLNNTYTAPPDWQKIGSWHPYIEVWQTLPNKTQNMFIIPLNYHKCNNDDLPYFYPIRR